MFRRFLLLALVMLVPAVAGAQANRDAIAKQLEANERAINAAIQKGDMAGFKALVADDTAAVITYRFTGKGSMMGQAMPSPVLASTTYGNRGGKWVAVFHQETIPTPAPPATKK